MSQDDLEVNTISLSGPVTMYEASGDREALSAAVNEGKPLRIDLANAGPWDVAGLQLMVSLVNTGRKAGVAVRLAHVPGVCRDVAERAGLSDWLAVAADSYQ